MIDSNNKSSSNIYRQISSKYTETGQHRIEALTGLRWLAALAVFMSHNPPGGQTPEWIRSFFGSGYVGVTLFFVLSGFILTVNYFEALSRPNLQKVTTFYIARLARIYPLYAFVLLFVTVYKLQTSNPSTSYWWQHLLSVQAWTYNDVFAWNGPGWSIGVEIFFYSLFPLIIYISRNLIGSLKGSIALFVFGILFAVFVLWISKTYELDSFRFLYIFPLSRLGDFIAGIGIAGIYLALHDSKLQIRRPMSYVALIAFFSIIVLMCSPEIGNSYKAESFDLLFLIPFSILILGISLSPRIGISKMLSLRLSIVLGEISYAFYLIHEPIGTSIFGNPLAEGLTLLNVVVFLYGLFFLVTMSWGLHVIIEKPARLFLRKITLKTNESSVVNRNKK